MAPSNSSNEGTAAAAHAHILVVDDNPQVTYVLTETLVAAGYAVHTAANGREAIALFEAEPPDGVLLDLRMPGMSGADVFTELQRIDAGVPVIFVTASDDEAMARDLLRAGAFDFISKPVDLNHLRVVVGAATGHVWPPPAAEAGQSVVTQPVVVQLAYAVVALCRRIAGPDADRDRLEAAAYRALRQALVGASQASVDGLLELRRSFASGALGWMSDSDAAALGRELILLDRYLTPADAGIAATDQTLPDTGAGGLGGVRVLVVDDEADSLDLMRVVLEGAGATVATASSAEDALTLLLSSGVDVLVSDIAMPFRNGYWLLRRTHAAMRRRNVRVAALAVTGFARDHDRALAIACGFDDYLAKPMEPAELCRRVAALAHPPPTSAGAARSSTP